MSSLTDAEVQRYANYLIQMTVLGGLIGAVLWDVVRCVAIALFCRIESSASRRTRIYVARMRAKALHRQRADFSSGVKP
nr:hypothetical protein [Delftia acidovorans]